MEGIMILVGIVALVVSIALAVQFRSIAAMKGHDEDKYFWWCLFLGIAGWLMVIALPDRAGEASSAAPTPVANELPDM